MKGKTWKGANDSIFDDHLRRLKCRVPTLYNDDERERQENGERSSTRIRPNNNFYILALYAYYICLSPLRNSPIILDDGERENVQRNVYKYTRARQTLSISTRSENNKTSCCFYCVCTWKSNNSFVFLFVWQTTFFVNGSSLYMSLSLTPNWSGVAGYSFRLCACIKIEILLLALAMACHWLAAV